MGNENVNNPLELPSYPGYGKTEKITDLPKSEADVTHNQKKKLGVFASTAICGNDISSSVLYVSALCAAQAGVLAPIVLLIVSGVLYLFRKVYAEVGSAIPLNGGTYTLLLNTTNKKTAAGAACLTLLSYIATAVISANEAMHYAHNLFNGLNIILATLCLLGIFALLNLMGISESAIVASIIFTIHIATLTLLTVAGAFWVIKDPSLLSFNWSLPSSEGVMHALFFGFAAAMLGISGFESSANFIEEQKEGVFPQTLRNMWIVVAIFNPLISLISIGLLPLSEIQTIPPDLLARMGSIAINPSFGWFISLDAVLVLSGAVLTSYVGVTGLVRRMSLDRCLPEFFLRENPLTKTNHWIIISFFLLCSSILFVTQGDVSRLAGVYSISFLGVMAFFAVGNMLLKRTRAHLSKEVKASWATVITALIAVLIGLLGNILMDPENLLVFQVYYLLVACAVTLMFLRIDIFKLILFLSHEFFRNIKDVNQNIHEVLNKKIQEINSSAVVFFTRGGDAPNLNKAALYVLENEETNNLKIVHLYEDEEKIPVNLEREISVIDQLYPQLKIDFLLVKGSFNADTIENLSQRLKVPKNMMFIGAPSSSFAFKLEELGNIRIIVV